MLVQKKSKQRQILLLIISLVILGAAVYLLTRGPEQPQDLSVFDGGDTTRPSVPIVNLDTTIFGAERITQLRDRSGDSYATQYSETPSDKDAVLPPEDVSVLNPQVGKKLIIYWENPDEKNTIRIYRSKTQEEAGTIIAEGIRSETSYQDTLLENNTRYYYTVKAVNDQGKESENTNQVTGVPTDIFPPQGPTGVVIKNLATGNEVEISWVNPTDSDFDYVRIYRSQKEGELGVPSLDEKVAQPTFIDDTVKEGITYYYTLTALDQSGNESEKSLLPVGGNKNPFQPSF